MDISAMRGGAEGKTRVHIHVHKYVAKCDKSYIEYIFSRAVPAAHKMGRDLGKDDVGLEEDVRLTCVGGVGGVRAEGGEVSRGVGTVPACLSGSLVVVGVGFPSPRRRPYRGNAGGARARASSSSFCVTSADSVDPGKGLVRSTGAACFTFRSTSAPAAAAGSSAAAGVLVGRGARSRGAGVVGRGRGRDQATRGSSCSAAARTGHFAGSAMAESCAEAGAQTPGRGDPEGRSWWEWAAKGLPVTARELEQAGEREQFWRQAGVWPQPVVLGGISLLRWTGPEPGFMWFRFGPRPQLGQGSQVLAETAQVRQLALGPVPPETAAPSAAPATSSSSASSSPAPATHLTQVHP
ncbi:hypothetical protein FIBSPDRAFT_890778 [Athelia psychrophila]|uniref:Uncharacterized protein n=1 Tax=Athelia psychrophila TaxID=1759441 RepID=A0A166KJM2_9AGAM|nr:hypothetical protein FIBSPDRAFT_890778 [Fibularhizoctonia sp. CBS 109695]